jgi:hypothetical protein
LVNPIKITKYIYGFSHIVFVLIGLKTGLFFTPNHDLKAVAIKIKIMIGSTILHYKILEKLSEGGLALRSFPILTGEL